MRTLIILQESDIENFSVEELLLAQAESGPRNHQSSIDKRFRGFQ